MLVLFEGPDGAGKTTLLREVFSRLGDAREGLASADGSEPYRGAVFRHLDRPAVVTAQGWPDAHIAHANYNVLSHFSFHRRDLLIDRLWVTDAVYGKVLARPAYDRSYVRPRESFGWVAVVHVTVDDPSVLRKRCSSTEPMWRFLERLRDEFFEYFAAPPVEADCEVMTVMTDIGVPVRLIADDVVLWLLGVERALANRVVKP